ncbi:MAG: transglycosylase SLT domain-containing protein [Ignavibacteriae bacterium]|nr:transglycosylase SLT domain-containing protein [Ignavibacteriota bacterium]
MASEINGLDTSAANSALQNSRMESIAKLKMTATDSGHLSEAQKKEYSKAARGFESMFVSMMMKQMKESMLDDDHKENGENMTFGADMLGSYADMQFSDFVSRSGKGMGLADMIYKKMTGGDTLDAISTEIPAAPIPQTGKSPSPLPSVKNDVIDTFSDRVENRLEKYDSIITAASKKFNVPDSLIKAVITAESAGKHNAVSSVGAKGLMQLMDGTANGLGVKNSFDPADNIHGGTKYLRQMLDEFGGNVDKALAAYNAGPGNVKKHGGIPPFQETQAYVRKVKHYAERYEA